MIVLDNFGTGRTLHQVHTQCAFQCNFTWNSNTVWCSLVYWTLVHGIRQYRNIYGKLLCAYVCCVMFVTSITLVYCLLVCALSSGMTVWLGMVLYHMAWMYRGVWLGLD